MTEYEVEHISKNKPCPFRRGDKVKLVHTDGLYRHKHYLGQTLTVARITEYCVDLVEYPGEGANFWARYELVKAREIKDLKPSKIVELG